MLAILNVWRHPEVFHRITLPPSHGGVMSITWILVANASAAYLYANYGPKKGLQKLKEFKHDASREKGQDLVTDRPGHNKSRGNGRGAYVPATDPKQNQAQNFAFQLAQELEHGRTTNSYQRLILVVSAPFMGLVNSSLGHHVRILVSDTFEKDYTKATERNLTRHLESCIFL
jgi:protein required for attachment to host cells